MTTNLLTTGGVDFDDCFEAGTGNQLLYIYTPDGTDIGQKYYPVSEGSAYGTTGMLAPSGADVGNLLCKKGTRDDGSVIMTVGKWTTTDDADVDTVHYGYSSGVSILNNKGSLSRVPYWGGTATYLRSLVLTGSTTSFTFTSSNKTRFPTGAGMTVNGIAITEKEGKVLSSTRYYYRIYSDALGLASKVGQQIKLTFSPAPTGFL